MGEFRMPSLGAEMDAGRLVEWKVAPGQEVHRGDIVAVVETDKAAIEVEVFEDGVVAELLVEEDARVPVGTPLARITPAAEAVPAGIPEPILPEPAPSGPSLPEPSPSGPSLPEPSPSGAAPPESRPHVRSPLVRRLADQRGVSLETVRGTGPGGEITRGDVAAAADAAGAARGPDTGRLRVSPYARRLAAARGIDLATVVGTGPGGAVVAGDLPAVPAAATSDTGHDGTEDPAASMRRAIARAMATSKRTIPHYYLGTWVDLHAAFDWLADHNADRSPRQRLIPAVLLCKAVALTVADYPELNGHLVDDVHRPAEHVHLGVAVSLRGGGLVAPAIHDADRCSLDELMARLRDLVKRARSGGLTGSEMTDPTLTVTNLGDQGVETVYPVIVPPQVAIVGFGRVTEQPVAVNGMLAVRARVHATLAADHRVSDGHRGGRFLADLARRLQTPEEL